MRNFMNAQVIVDVVVGRQSANVAGIQKFRVRDLLLQRLCAYLAGKTRPTSSRSALAPAACASAGMACAMRRPRFMHWHEPAAFARPA